MACVAGRQDSDGLAWRKDVGMGWFFSDAGSFLEPELEEWHLAAWQWMLANMGGIQGIRARALVLPRREFFPPTDAQGHWRALHVFEQVKWHAGLADWPCELIAQPRTADLPGQRSAAAGTFGVDGNMPAISYDPGLADDPMKLVAVLAHELAHLRMTAFSFLPPGGGLALERATDLIALAMGFGVFGGNCAFAFERHQDGASQGWRMQRLGYLEEREWVFGLAIFLLLRGETAAPVKQYLKSHLFVDLRRAMKSIERRGILLTGFGDLLRLG